MENEKNWGILWRYGSPGSIKMKFEQILMQFMKNISKLFLSQRLETSSIPFYDFD